MPLSVLSGLMLLLVAGCGDTVESTTPSASPDVLGPPRIVVSSWPLLDLAQTVCGSAATVQLPAPPQTLPRLWKPTSDEARQLQSADLILLNGAGYEPWKSRVSLPGSRVVDTARGYYDQFIRIPDAVVHQHGPEGQHSHAGTVWSTWLDPELVAAQLSELTKACVRTVPEHATQFETVAARLNSELSVLNTMTVTLRESTKSMPPALLADGPYYHYLSRRLGWPDRYLHWENSAEELTADEKSELTSLIQSEPALAGALFLLNSERPESAAQFVASSGLRVVRVDLCERAAKSGATGLIERLTGNLEQIKTALSEQ
jgi:zinc transport system substrate-binding protein